MMVACSTLVHSMQAIVTSRVQYHYESSDKVQYNYDRPIVLQHTVKVLFNSRLLCCFSILEFSAILYCLLFHTCSVFLVLHTCVVYFIM